MRIIKKTRKTIALILKLVPLVLLLLLANSMPYTYYGELNTINTSLQDNIAYSALINSNNIASVPMTRPSEYIFVSNSIFIGDLGYIKEVYLNSNNAGNRFNEINISFYIPLYCVIICTNIYTLDVYIYDDNYNLIYSDYYSDIVISSNDIAYINVIFPIRPPIPVSEVNLIRIDLTTS